MEGRAMGADAVEARGRIDVREARPGERTEPDAAAARLRRANDIVIALERGTTGLEADILRRLPPAVAEVADTTVNLTFADREPAFAIRLSAPGVEHDATRRQALADATREAVVAFIEAHATRTGAWQPVVEVSPVTPERPGRTHGKGRRAAVLAGLAGAAIAGLAIAYLIAAR